MNRLTAAFVVLVLVLHASPVSKNALPHWIVWDVGQGLWVTYSDVTRCLHFDMGGENFPQGIKEECGHKKNYANFSHWDWDHINLARKAWRDLPHLCLLTPPNGETKAKKLRFINKIPKCSGELQLKGIQSWTPKIHSSKNSNALSRIYFTPNILLPGDTTQKMEKVWSDHVYPTIRLLVLGHHGSKTSTSKYLLMRLNRLQLAVASARRKRYGHPHQSTQKKLRNHGVSLIETENWGNIRTPYLGEYGLYSISKSSATGL